MAVNRSEQQFGFNQQWQTVTGSRVIGTVYTNTKRKVIGAWITVSVPAGGRTQAWVSGGNPLLWDYTNSSAVAQTAMFFVMAKPGETYYVFDQVGTSTLIRWVEMS